MIATDVDTISRRLVRMLSEQHDDGSAALVVEPELDGLYILRADGSELSASEAAHVTAILAAHAAEPIV